MRRDWTPERAAIVAVALVAVVFGLQSAIDWTWFVPGPAVMALASAGYVAGRGPLESRGRPTVAAALRPRPEPLRVAAAIAVAIIAILCVWAIWQPEASERDSNRALALTDAHKIAAARSEAISARDANPLSPRPLIIRASVEEAGGNEVAALGTLEEAALEFPGDPQTWLRLAGFQLQPLDQPDKALDTLGAALYLDPHSKVGRALFLQARQRARAKQLAAQVKRARRAKRAQRAKRTRR